MSQTTTSSFETDGKFSPGFFAYVGERARNRCYDFVIKRFRASGITKAELARRLGKGPDRVGHILASPGNWTIDTMAELLLCISREEFLPHAESFQGRAPRNISQSDILRNRAGGVSIEKSTPAGSSATVARQIEFVR